MNSKLLSPLKEFSVKKAVTQTMILCKKSDYHLLFRENANWTSVQIFA
jgi:hypothetical protein